MPDSIAAYTVDGATYLVTANEGDARDYDGYGEEARLADLVLDATVFPNAGLPREENLGRLRVSAASTDSKRQAGGFHRRLWRAFLLHLGCGRQPGLRQRRCRRAHHSRVLADVFNSSGENETFDERSDDKGRNRGVGGR